jgi:hypothetical protein
LVDSATSVALPREPEEQSNRDAEPKGSQHKPSANIETDGPHHQETNRDQNSGKLRVHLHHAHNARVAIGIAVLHLGKTLEFRHLSLAGFEVIIVGRFEVITEAINLREWALAGWRTL